MQDLNFYISSPGWRRPLISSSKYVLMTPKINQNNHLFMSVNTPYMTERRRGMFFQVNQWNAWIKKKETWNSSCYRSFQGLYKSCFPFLGLTGAGAAQVRGSLFSACAQIPMCCFYLSLNWSWMLHFF